MDAKVKPAKRRSATTLPEVIPVSEALQSDINRPEPPDGMVYNRRGALVKQRKKSVRTSKLFVVMQIIEDDGTVNDNYTKKNIKILKTERNSDKVLEMIDSGDYDGAFYVRLDLLAK